MNFGPTGRQYDVLSDVTGRKETDMAKKPTPVITHTEILSYAIRMANVDWREDECRYEAALEKDADLATMIQTELVAPKRAKLEALLTLYKMETGCDYGIDIN